MAQNGTLTPKQHSLLAGLLSGEKVEQAAAHAKISKRTAFRWIKEPAFCTAMEQAEHKSFEAKLKILRNGVSTALLALQRNMSSEAPPAVQVRAAAVWLTAAIELHKMSQLEEKVAELEEMLRPANHWRTL